MRWTLLGLGLALAGNAAGQGPPIGFRLGADRTEVRPGGRMVLTVTARIPRGWHLYGLRQPAGGPLATVLQVGPERVFSLASPVTSSRAKAELDPNFGMVVEWHNDSATFRIPVQAARNALPGTYDALVRVSYQRCNDRICLPLKTDTLKAPLTIAGAPEAARPRPGAARESSASAPVRRPIALAGVATLQDPWLEDTGTATTMFLLGDSADVEAASRSGGLLRYLLPAAVILMLVLAASTRRKPQEPPQNPFGLSR